MPLDQGGASHALAAIAYLALLAMLMRRWGERAHAAAWAVACAASMLWALGSAVAVAPDLLEAVRSAAWIALLDRLLGRPGKWRGAALAALIVLSAASAGAPNVMLRIGARLVLAVAGLVMLETLYRDAPESDRWALKFACIGIGTVLAYDFFLYSEAALFHRINDEIRDARGLVNALAVPLLAASASRNARWSRELTVSRAVVLHSATIVGAAIYLLAMASSGYYLRYVGGAWGRIMQLAFLCGACMLLAGALFSGAVRARAKVFISKHFFARRFDYREEWMRLTRALAQEGPALNERSIEAIAALVESPAGALWLRRAGAWQVAGLWNMAPCGASAAFDDPYCRLLEQRQWLVEVPVRGSSEQGEPALAMPAWLAALPRLWLVVPLMLDGALFGFVTLARPRTPIKLDWEVRDVLKIAGSQAASYLAHRESLDSLMVARQFESFNRMSTFVVHDLKNLVFQLSLLLANAEKHQDKPAFRADMLATLDHSVQKMKALLQKLRRSDEPEPLACVPLDEMLRQIVDARALAQPRPVLLLHERAMVARVQRARLDRVVGHIVDNAIDATAPGGSVTVQLRRKGEWALIEVCDSGHGMSERYMRERLFKPFESTKAAGMGIGVFESREYLQEVGGRLEVDSVQGRGTTFTLHLPLHMPKEVQDGKAQAAGH
ncbi:MAG: XrtA/PEP-CTERM system histidine kinase PrsK [Pseudomonadota bacterium]